MDRDSCVSLLNMYIQSPLVTLGESILKLYLEDKDVPDKEQIITMLVQTPGLNAKCINIAIEEICKKFQINSITKNNQTIHFY